VNSYTRLFFKGEAESSLRAATHIVPLLMELCAPQSVIDIGCGVGAWLATFAKYGVRDILGVDGSYIQKDLLLIEAPCFKEHDLTKPLPVTRRFDLALCLEVAEHLPASGSRDLVGSLARLSPFVLFSAAIPNQCGAHHINEQWQEHWVDLFAAEDLVVVDVIRPRIWDNSHIDPWYIQNLLLFVKPSVLSSHTALLSEYNSIKAQPISLVHPRVYLSWSDPTQMTLRKYLKASIALPYALRNSLLPRLRTLLSLTK